MDQRNLPSRNERTCSNPKWSASGRQPTAEQTENRPPWRRQHNRAWNRGQRNLSNKNTPWVEHSSSLGVLTHDTRIYTRQLTTQSQNPKTFSGRIPNSEVALILVLTATICLPIEESSFNFDNNHWRIVRAFSIVSAVVNVLEITITNVVSGLRPSVARATSMGSTLARKRNCLLSDAFMHGA